MNLVNNISSVVLAFIICFVQLLPVKMDETKPIYQLGWIKWINANSIAIVAICSVLIILITVVCAIVEKETGNKKWLTSVLQEMVDNYLYGQNYHTRITVFKTNHRNTFLKCYSRFGYPQNLYPKPPHKVPISKEYGSYNGIVGKCLAEGTDVECHTDVLGMDLQKKFENNDLQNQEKIKKYMEDTFIPDYKVLHSMHKRSTNFYAYPIVNKNAKIWGVLIIDNDESKIFDFEKVKYVMKTYSDLITLTLNL